jgi:hypothetical protein
MAPPPIVDAQSNHEETTAERPAEQKEQYKHLAASHSYYLLDILLFV